MSYAWLAASVTLGTTLLSAFIAAGLPRSKRPGAASVGLTLAALLVLTAVFDNLMIAAGLFHYAAERTSGISIVLAPIEDFSYPLVAGILLPVLWTWLTTRRPGQGRGRRPARADERWR